MTSDDTLRKLLTDGRTGVLAALKRDGRPQLSTVSYALDGDLIGDLHLRGQLQGAQPAP